MNLELCNKEFKKISGLDPLYFDEPTVWEKPIFLITSNSPNLTNRESEDSLDIAMEANEVLDTNRLSNFNQLLEVMKDTQDN
jgi:hypothetical protein